MVESAVMRVNSGSSIMIDAPQKTPDSRVGQSVAHQPGDVQLVEDRGVQRVSVARAQKRGPQIGFIGDGDVVYARREDEVGNTLIDVWRIELSRPSAQ